MNIPNRKTCIYNSHHLVREDKLALHEKNCRAYYLQDTSSPYHERAKKIAICSFNHSHHVEWNLLSQHYENCIDAVGQDEINTAWINVCSQCLRKK